MTTELASAKARLSAQLGGWELPLGWFAEIPEWLPDCIAIGNKSLGWVTVDMKGRFFGVGFCRPRLRSGFDSRPLFTGSGWRRRIMEAAEEHLRACNSCS